MITAVQIDIENCCSFRKIMLDLLQAEVLRLGQREVDDGNGENQNGREEEKSSRKCQVVFEDGEDLEADDEQDACEAPAKAFAECPDL